MTLIKTGNVAVIWQGRQFNRRSFTEETTVSRKAAEGIKAASAMQRAGAAEVATGQPGVGGSPG